MAHSGPSWACALFAPRMSVRIFGHFEQFSTFPPAVHHVQPPHTAGRMDQWTTYDMGVMNIGPNGSHKMWAKRSNLRQGASPKWVWTILRFSALVDPVLPVTRPRPMGILDNQVRVSPHWTPIGWHTEKRVRSPSRRGGILLGILLFLAQFRLPKLPPLGTPISAHRVVD